MNPANSVEEIAWGLLAANLDTGSLRIGERKRLADDIADFLRAERERGDDFENRYNLLIEDSSIVEAELRAQLAAERERRESMCKALQRIKAVFHDVSDLSCSTSVAIQLQSRGEEVLALAINALLPAEPEVRE